jgi:hypothetical protein
MIYLILKNNYVINRVLGEPIEHEGDTTLPDTNESISIGDWYEEGEEVFYRPQSKPQDPNLPEQISHLWDVPTEE